MYTHIHTYMQKITYTSCGTPHLSRLISAKRRSHQGSSRSSGIWVRATFWTTYVSSQDLSHIMQNLSNILTLQNQQDGL